MNRGVYITGGGSSVTSLDGDITILGTGNGSLHFNRGIETGFASIATGGTLAMTGTGGGGTGGVFNTGIYFLNSAIGSAGNDVNLTGNGGLGASYNEGVRAVGGSLSGTLNLQGIASGSTTGYWNSGVYILNTNLGNAGGTIAGTGGGGLGFNHGIFFRPLGGIFGGGTSGTAGPGTPTSKDIY
jgi:hypothetical protein